MKKEFLKFFWFAQIGGDFLLLLLLRCPFDFLFSAYHANLMKRMFDAIEAKSERQLIWTFFLFLLAALLLFLYNGTIWVFFSKYIARLGARVRIKLFEKITSLSYRTVSEQSAGEWVTLMNSDTEIAVNVIGGVMNTPHGAVALTSVLLSAIVLAVLDWKIFLLSLCFIIPHFCFSLVRLVKPMTGLKEQSQQELANLTAWIAPVIESNEVIQLYGAEEFLRSKIEENSLRLRANQMKIHRKNAINNSLMPLFGVSGYLAMLLFGARQIRQQECSFGDLTKKIQYRGSYVAGVVVVLRCFMNIRTNFAGVKRVNDVIEKK